MSALTTTCVVSVCLGRDAPQSLGSHASSLSLATNSSFTIGPKRHPEVVIWGSFVILLSHSGRDFVSHRMTNADGRLPTAVSPATRGGRGAREHARMLNSSLCLWRLPWKALPSDLPEDKCTISPTLNWDGTLERTITLMSRCARRRAAASPPRRSSLHTARVLKGGFALSFGYDAGKVHGRNRTFW